MQTKVLLLTLGVLLCGMLWGQPMFELLLPISEIDRSNTGYDLLFDPENEHYYVLSNTQIHDYLQTTGIPIEGEFTLGTSLTKLDLNGEIIWNELIRTNCPYDTCPFILELHGRLPAEILMINNLGNIVLPYSAFYGFVICGGKRLTDDQTVSVMSVYDRNYNRVYHRVFENRKLVDAEFYEGQIVYIESLRSSASSMEEKPIRVGTIDIESQLEESNTFGFPYVDGRKISVFSNGQIGVVGSSVSSFLETSERRSNQTYVLVTHIADIVSSRVLNNPNPEQLTLFPNPATDYLEIKGLFDDYSDKTIDIYDLLGRKIDDCELNDGYSIDISRLPPGIYALILKAGSRILTNGKFVKI